MNAIVMAWGDQPEGFGQSAEGSAASQAALHLYLVDLDRQRIHYRKGSPSGAPQMLETMLADFIGDRKEWQRIQSPSSRVRAIPESVPSSPPRRVRVSNGIKVYGVLDQQVSSKRGKSLVGEDVAAHIWRDVIADGQVLIAAGAPIVARVGYIKSAKVAGVKGKVRIDALSTTAVDGAEVQLVGGYDHSGKSRTGGAAAAAALVAWPLIFIKGKQAVLNPGTVFDATTAKPLNIVVQNPRAAQTEQQSELAAEILYEFIDPEADSQKFPVSLENCNHPFKTANVITFNDEVIPIIPVELQGVFADGDCHIGEGSISMKELSEYLVPGINRFEIEAGGARAEIILEDEF
jgi:hypothetical protein